MCEKQDEDNMLGKFKGVGEDTPFFRLYMTKQKTFHLESNLPGYFREADDDYSGAIEELRENMVEEDSDRLVLVILRFINATEFLYYAEGLRDGVSLYGSIRSLPLTKIINLGSQFFRLYITKKETIHLEDNLPEYFKEAHNEYSKAMEVLKSHMGDDVADRLGAVILDFIDATEFLYYTEGVKDGVNLYESIKGLPLTEILD